MSSAHALQSPEQVTLAIEGMSCASCVGRVERALKRVPGVLSAEVNLATEQASVTRLAGSAPSADLVAAVTQAGYAAHDQAQAHAATSSGLGAGASVLLAALLSAPLALPMLGGLAGQHWMLPGWLQWLLATPVQFVLGARFYRAGWKA